MANNPPPTLPPPACPLPHPGLQASPPQPGQLSSCAGPSTATGTPQHPAPDIPPPAPKQSPPTKPPLSRRPLTRASASRIEDRLQQHPEKTQQQPAHPLPAHQPGQQPGQQPTPRCSRSAHRTHPSRSLSDQPPPPLPDSWTTIYLMLPLHIPDYIANVHDTTPKPDPDHHSELAPPDPSQSALLFLGIVLHLIIPKHDALLRVIVAVHLVEIEPDTIETEDPGPMKNQASAAQLCFPKPVNLSRHSPTPRKPTPHREDRDLQHHVRHWIWLRKDPPLAPLKALTRKPLHQSLFQTRLYEINKLARWLQGCRQGPIAHQVRERGTTWTQMEPQDNLHYIWKPNLQRIPWCHVPAAIVQTYTSASKSQIYIKADKKMIENMASFARAGLLHVHLAKRAKGYYIETHNLLTVVTPTGLEEKPLFDKDDSNTIYHRTEWDVIPKDWWKTLEDTIRPSGWSRNADNIPNQYPCFGFFGYGAEIVTSSALSDWAVNICTSGLYKIGKGQLPAGLIATCRTPKLNKNMAGGNDQLQRACRREESQKGRTVSLQQIPLPVPLPSLTPSTHHTLQRPPRGKTKDEGYHRWRPTFRFICALHYWFLDPCAPVLDEQYDSPAWCRLRSEPLPWKGKIPLLQRSLADRKHVF